MRPWIFAPLLLVGCLEPIEAPQNTTPVHDTGVTPDVSEPFDDAGGSDANLDTNVSDSSQDAALVDTGRDVESDATVANFTVRRRPMMEALSSQTFETEPILEEVVWTSSDPSVLSFTGDVATAHKRGTVTVTATHDGMSANEQVTVFWQIEEIALGSKNYDGNGETFICVATSTGRTFCWGENTSGQTLTAASSVEIAPWASELSSGRFNKLEAGDSFVCGVAPNDSNRVRCWGNNDSRELGNLGTTDTHVPTLVSLDSNQTYDDLQCRGSSCCVRSANDVHCWGKGIDPATVPGFESPEGLAKGGDHVCILRGGEVLCLGDGLEGQLGNGYPATSTSPLTVKTITNVEQIWAGDDHNCAKLPPVGSSDPVYRCWGENSYSQIGLSAGSSDDDPHLIAPPVPFNTLFVGSDTSCGLASNGTAYCWGANLFGTLGTGSQDESTHIPTALNTAVKFKKIEIGGLTACGISVDDDLYCWGANSPAIVPNTSNELYSPVRVPNPWELSSEP